jgi:hypothetical protein
MILMPREGVVAEHPPHKLCANKMQQALRRVTPTAMMKTNWCKVELDYGDSMKWLFSANLLIHQGEPRSSAIACFLQRQVQLFGRSRLSARFHGYVAFLDQLESREVLRKANLHETNPNPDACALRCDECRRRADHRQIEM